MQIEVPSHKAKRIAGITRKHTSDFSLLALGFNILALITFNTKKLFFFFKKSKTSEDLQRRGKMKEKFLLWEKLTLMTGKSLKWSLVGWVLGVTHPKAWALRCAGPLTHCHPRCLSLLISLLPQPICAVGILTIMWKMLCVWEELFGDPKALSRLIF